MSDIAKEFIEILQERAEHYEYDGDVNSFDLQESFNMPTITQISLDNGWRFPIEFDDYSSEYWYKPSLALFVGGLEFKASAKIEARVYPMIGEESDLESALLGTGKLYSDKFEIGFGYGFDPITNYSGIKLSSYFQCEFNNGQDGWDEYLATKLPRGFNTPFSIWSCELVSYALGKSVLINGMRKTFSAIDNFNKILEDSFIDMEDEYSALTLHVK